jgi:D-aspartate ligase
MTTSSETRPAVLLASASTGGTIAAVRQLDSSGLKVHIIWSSLLDAAAWSRSISRRYRAPPESRTRAFLDRLLAIGYGNPGQVLLATSDETAWLYARYRSLLEKYFRLYQPSISVMRQILDKKLLAEATSRAGIAVLPSWFPQNRDDVNRIAASLPYPILIKPRTQVHRLRNNKGWIVATPEELIQKYSEIIEEENALNEDDPICEDAGRFILQQFVQVGSEGVQSVSGFIDQRGEHYVTRRSAKVFQRTPPVGVGVCYESVPCDRELSSSVNRLCRELGFFGIFEVEFVRLKEKWAVIDFNPRFYNQMGLDIHLGLPLPLLAYLDACDERQALADAVASAHGRETLSQTALFDHFTMKAILFVNRFVSLSTSKNDAYWRAWVKKNGRYSIDIASSDGDPLPRVIHALSEVHRGIKAFPRLFKSRAGGSSSSRALRA